MEKQRKAWNKKRWAAITVILALLTLPHLSRTGLWPRKVMGHDQHIEMPLQAKCDGLGNTLEDMVVFLPVPGLRVDTVEAFTPMPVPLSEDLQMLVWDLCGDHDTPISRQDFFQLVLKVMWNESRHQLDVQDNRNRNGTTDRGPMQINSCNWGWLAKEGLDINQPEQNIEAGIRMLATYLEDYQDVEYALTAYAYGPTGAWELGGKSDTAKRIINLNLEEAVSIEFGGSFLFFLPC